MLYNFQISKEDKNKALQEIRKLIPKETIAKDYKSHLKGISIGDFAFFTNLEETLAVWGWKAFNDDFGNVVLLEDKNYNYDESLLLFTAIAPYVKKDSKLLLVDSYKDKWWLNFSGSSVSVEAVSTPSF